MTRQSRVRSPVMANAQLYVVNMSFDGGDLGEVIEADPKLVADWIEAGWVSPVDEHGDRIITVTGPRGGVKEVTDPGAAPVDLGTARPLDQPDE